MIHAIAALFLTNLLLANSQLCSLDYTIKCSFQYKSHKNCNRIGGSCDSFRILEWMNITDDQKTCSYNSGSLFSQSFELDGYSICSSVGPLTRPGTIGANCYCSANGIVETSKRYRATGYVVFGDLSMPTSSPTLAPTRLPTPPTYIPTSSPTLAPTRLPTPPTYIPIIPDMNAYFTSLCPSPHLIFTGSIPGLELSTLKKCSAAEFEQPTVLTKSYVIVQRGGIQFGDYQHIYYRCTSTEGPTTIRKVTDSEIVATLTCDGENRYVNLPLGYSKYHDSPGYIELIAHN